MLDMRLLGLLPFLAATASAQIDPRYAVNVTVYHLHPNSTGSKPINMDTGDAEGDLYFYLDEFLLPLECANATGDNFSKFDCDNPERIDPNLVVSKVDLEVDSRWTTYSACNLCNGSDPFSGKPCEEGTYVCDCFGLFCNNRHVGRENLTAHFLPPPQPAPKCAAAMNETCGSVRQPFRNCSTCMASHAGRFLALDSCKIADMFGYCTGAGHHWGHECTAASENYECWRTNLPKKTGGFWYSTLAQGQCQDDSKQGSCGWKIRSTTSVRNNCVKDSLMSVTEAAAQDCFGACGKRNTTSPCWIGCFFDTVLGPKARNSTEVAGMPLETLTGAFTGSFKDESQGGCPRVPDESVPQLAKLAVNSFVV